MLNEVDKESLKYDILIKFCEKHNITDIDSHYYIKLAYENLKDKVDNKTILDFLESTYLAMEEHFFTKYYK